MHQQNPLHRIQRWTGTHFRTAELWEVGGYLLVPHHAQEPLCETLKVQIEYLEQFEVQKDAQEQTRLSRSAEAAQSAEQWRTPTPTGRHTGNNDMDCEPDGGLDDWDAEKGDETMDNSAQELLEDQEFESYLDRLRRRQQNLNDDEDEEERDELVHDPDLAMEDDDDTVVADEDADAVLPQYLPNQSFEDFPYVPTRDAFQNCYIRIVHTNGLHHLAMVSCQCRGADSLALDLIASRLLPASFDKIRTLFSAQVLDFFRLCNLEMKASAYSFYHLLRRLTMPMAPAEVVDLYNEFRRMTRLWRWMKKLKWAGYGHNGKDPTNVGAGELANYCAACPQPGVNLPENWREDPNR